MRVIPKNIENFPPENRPVRTFEAIHLHHKHHHFPVVPPDYYVNEETVGRKKCRSRSEKDVEKIHDPVECRERFLKMMNEHCASKNSTFRTNCKHMVPGTGYKQIEGRFYIPEMTMGEKYRIKVSITDENGDFEGYSYIEFAHTPLWRSGQGNARGLAKRLYNNAMIVNPENNNIRPATLSGSMAASGFRLYDGELIPYKNTHPSQEGLLDSAERWMRKWGFGAWSNLLRDRMRQLRTKGVVRGFGKLPWCSLLITSSNYGNECHQDQTDNSQALTIWHETHPHNPEVENPKKSVKNWYFLFPDLFVKVNDTWQRGVAIPLTHGTIVTWDARVVRHCTAYPDIINEEAFVFGTYFGITDKVANFCEKREKKRKADIESKRRATRTKNKNESFAVASNKCQKVSAAFKTESAYI